MTAWITIKSGKRKFRSAKIERIIDAGDERDMTVKFSKRQRSVASSSSSRGKKLKAQLVVQVTDGDNEIEKTKTIYIN